MIGRAIRDLGQDGLSLQGELELLSQGRSAGRRSPLAGPVRKVCRFRHRPPELRQLNLTALRRAIEDLSKDLPASTPRAGVPEPAGRPGDAAWPRSNWRWPATTRARKQQIPGVIEQFRTLQREALLANPLLNFDRLLLVRRKADQLGPAAELAGQLRACRATATTTKSPSSRRSGRRRKLTTLYKPAKGEFVGDVDLHFDAGQDAVLDARHATAAGRSGRSRADGTGLRQVTPGEEPDVDNYDACYLPDGRIIFDSTRCFQGVPCVGGGNTVANLFLMDADGTERPPAVLRPGPRLVPDRAEQRPRPVLALGILRLAALLHAAAVPA